MQKAIKWLDALKISYHFHNYKESGIDEATLKIWLSHFPTNLLINTKGTTYKALSDADKASIADPSCTIALMMANTSLIKRPVWDFGNGKFLLGWNETEVKKIIG